MRCAFTRIGMWKVLACLVVRSLSALDSDGDGVVDAEDPNPNDSRVVPWRSLGSWRFSTGGLNGDEGQIPTVQTSVTAVPDGFAGGGVRFPAGSRSSLKYRAVELSGRPNISAVRGSILFRIKPDWASGSGPGGPGGWATVLQTTNFAVQIAPNGSSLVLTSSRSGGTVTNVQMRVSLRRNNWSYGLVTYSPEESSLSLDAPSTRVTGPGIVPPTSLNDPNHFLAIGSSADGTGTINGTLDEIVAFNAPGILGVTPTAISAVPSDSPAGLELVWNSATNALTEVKRRVVGAANWETTRAAVGTSFLDTTAVEGERYEYNINTRIAHVTTGLPDDVGQFLKATRKGAPVHQRGKIILLVDETMARPLEEPLSDYISNLTGDGWHVLRVDVPRHVDDYSTPSKFLTNYHNITNVITPFIRSNYAQFGSQIKYILAIGHVPIPYTGTVADDGHNTAAGSYGAHTGAWATDLYYGDVDGTWTDIQNVQSPSFPFNRNAPGDGRLDQNKLPANRAGVSALEIGVARIDFALLPAFRDSETTLLKKYLQKNAEFRKGSLTYPANTIFADYLAVKTPLAPELATQLSSKAGVLQAPGEGDVFAERRRFLFGIQCGPGAFDRINDAYPGYMHTTEDIARGNVRGANCAFFYLRGSYFPDWNSQNNLLRAVLGLPDGGLAVAGFLNQGWRADGLAVGLSLGDELTDIATTLSTQSHVQSVRWVQILGDPTLRYPVVAPPGNPTLRRQNELSWRAASGAIGYYVYRADSGDGTFQLITPDLVKTTTYRDLSASGGKPAYMIRSAHLSTTGGGTFTNLSQGVFIRP